MTDSKLMDEINEKLKYTHISTHEKIKRLRTSDYFEEEFIEVYKSICELQT